jgi:hypothetical protein
MQLTKEDLIKAHEQGLVLKYDNNEFKIVAILNDVYAINYLDSKKVMWWIYESFADCTIEQPKPEYNGRAVKCDSVEQLEWYCKHNNFEYTYSVLIMLVNDSKNIGIENNAVYTDDYAKEINYEIISFSQYCQEQGIKEPKWIQVFEVRDGYNDVVMVSDDNERFWLRKLIKVIQDTSHPFLIDGGTQWRYCRLLKRSEINEIKFID